MPTTRITQFLISLMGALVATGLLVGTATYPFV